MRRHGLRAMGIAVLFLPLMLCWTVSWSDDGNTGGSGESGDDTGASSQQGSHPRFQVDAWVGEVINKYASADRAKALLPEGNVNGNDIDRFAGLAVDFNIWGTPPKDENVQSFSVHALVKAVHTARIVETPCTSGDTQCMTDNSGNPIPDPTDFLKLVKDSSVLEWHAGFRFDWQFRKDTVFYGKGMLGFVRSVDSGDDVINDHFGGIGLRYVDDGSWFRNSYMEAGFGQTDLFATHRTGRKKVDARLEISRPGKKPETQNIGASPLSFFLEGYLDSDFGKGSDDIRIFLGVGFDIRQLIDTVKKSNGT